MDGVYFPPHLHAGLVGTDNIALSELCVWYLLSLFIRRHRHPMPGKYSTVHYTPNLQSILRNLTPPPRVPGGLPAFALRVCVLSLSATFRRRPQPPAAARV